MALTLGKEFALCGTTMSCCLTVLWVCGLFSTRTSHHRPDNYLWPCFNFLNEHKKSLISFFLTFCAAANLRKASKAQKGIRSLVRCRGFCSRRQFAQQHFLQGRINLDGLCHKVPTLIFLAAFTFVQGQKTT